MSYQPNIEKSVLVVFGYKTGAKGGYASDRRSRIQSCFRADLRSALTDGEFLTTQAEYWGEPRSAERLLAICKCIAQPLRGWYGKRQFADAVIQRVRDLDFCKAELLTPEIATYYDFRNWPFPSADDADVAWAFES